MYQPVAVLVLLAIGTSARADEPPAVVTPPALTVPAAAPVAEPAPPPDVVPLYADSSLRMTVNVRIADKGPYSFIVDTGSQGTVLARELAEDLALRDGKPMTVHTMAVSKAVRTAQIPSLAANALVVKKINAPLFDRYNLGADGVLGLDALRSQRMTLDFAGGTMTLTPSKTPPEKWDGESIVVTARSRIGQLILTNASIAGEQVLVILDTGGEVSLGNLALRRRLQDHHVVGMWSKIHLLDVAGGVTEVDYTLIDHLRIASIDFHNLPMAFGDAHMFDVLDLTRTPAMLLGMDALRMFGRVAIDFGKQNVRFLRPEETIQSSSLPAANEDLRGR